jgi:hypothetical protein
MRRRYGNHAAVNWGFTTRRAPTELLMLLLSLLGKSVAAKAVIGVATVSLSGVTVAAGTGSLPPSVQQMAYDVAGDIGVPAPAETAPAETAPADAAPTDTAPTDAAPTDAAPTDAAPTVEPPGSEAPGGDPSGEPSEDADGDGPDATGPAAKGLCQAYRHGGVKAGSAKERALAGAAGGVDKIGAYCDTVLAGGDQRRPGKSPAPATAAPAAEPAKTKKAEPAKTKEPRPAKTKEPQPAKTKQPQPTKDKGGAGEPTGKGPKGDNGNGNRPK